MGQKHGGFDPTMVIQGSIADLHIWDNAVTSATAESISNWACQSTLHFKKGDIFDWETILSSPLKGEIIKTCPATCHK